jgi:Chalcone isomerase-like
MRKLLLPGALWLCCALAPAMPAGAATLADVSLPDRIEAAGQPLVLNGLGLRKKLFVKVYVGALYLPAPQKSAAGVLAGDTVRRMVLHFLYSVSPAQMCDAWNEGLADNTPNASAEVKAGFSALCADMESIPSGTELVLTYTPGKGTLVEIGSKMKGTIPGKATSDAMLNTWIGPHPAPGDDFKKAVLGGH